MKIRNAAIRFGRRLAVGTSVSLLPALPAVAAVDAAVTTALSEGKADAIVIGGAVLVLLVAIVVFKYIRKAM